MLLQRELDREAEATAGSWPRGFGRPRAPGKDGGRRRRPLVSVNSHLVPADTPREDGDYVALNQKPLKL